MEVLARKTRAWARKDKLLSKTLRVSKNAHTNKPQQGVRAFPTKEMQSGKNTTAHSGFLLEARHPDSVLRPSRSHSVKGRKAVTGK